MVGLFPSNFVKVLDENFSPEKARKVSNAAAAAAAANANSQPQQKPKTVFRKPFQGYKEAVGPSEALRQKKEAKEASIATSIPDHRLALARKRSATRPQRPTSKP
ncbi:cytokinesis protein 3, partial [Ascosphaera acerosa]